MKRDLESKIETVNSQIVSGQILEASQEEASPYSSITNTPNEGKMWKNRTKIERYPIDLKKNGLEDIALIP